MKVLFILPQIYPFYTGGAEIFHYHLLLQLSSEYAVGYIGYDNINEKDVRFYKIKKVKPWKLFTPLQTILHIIRQRNNYDMIHLNYSQSSWVHWFYFPILKKVFRIKYGITIHDPSLYEWKNKRIFANVFKKAKFVVAVSERLVEGYENRCEREIVYLPPLMPLKKCKEDRQDILSKYGYDKCDKIILFVATLKASKRPLILFEAIKMIDRKWLDTNKIKLVYAGSGEQSDILNESINSSGLSSYFRMVGRIPQEDLNFFYKMACCYVIPSIHEGKSMSLIEAMFNQLPIIASNAPGINDIVFDGKNGLLFDLDSPSHLVTQIVRIVEDDILSERLANQAYIDYQDQFRFENMLNRYLELYKG